MVTFQLPKIEADQVIVLNTEGATDAVVALGKLTVKDENGSNALVMKVTSDLLSASKTAYAAGTKSVKTVTVPTPVSDAMYSITIALPYRKDFAMLGKESNAVVALRTYTVSTDSTATATELKNAFVAKINADPGSGVVAASTGAGTFSVTLADVNSGDSVITVPAGFSVSVGTPYVMPSGTESEVNLYSNITLTGGEYTKYILKYRKHVRHAALSGLMAVKEAIVIIFAEENATNFAAFETAMDAAIDGTYGSPEDYLGA